MVPIKFLGCSTVIDRVRTFKTIASFRLDPDGHRLALICRMIRHLSLDRAVFDT